MLRRLHNALSLVSLLLLVGVLALWRMSRDGTDTVVIRTAPSYAWGPGLKWVGVDNRDGLLLTCLIKSVPLKPREVHPPWREDVGFDATAASVELGGLPVPARTLTTAEWPAGRPLTPTERRNYDAVTQARYRARPLVQFGYGQHVYPVQSAPAGPAAQRLGVFTILPRNLIDEGPLPGAYRLVGVRVPFALAAIATLVLPLFTVPRWVGRWRVSRRVRAGHCPDCDYDLRGTPDRCPECGRRVAPGEARNAAESPDGGTTAPRTPVPRRTLLRVGCLAAGGALSTYVAVRAIPLPAPVGATTGALRHGLDQRLAVIGRRVERLRAAGDAAGADKLAAELDRLRRLAAGEPPPRGDEPRLHVIGTLDRERKAAGDVHVLVTTTDHPVVLALRGNVTFTWKLYVAPDVRLAKVLLVGEPNQRVQGLPTGVPLEYLAAEDGGQLLFPDVRYGTADRNPASGAAVARRTGLRVWTYEMRWSYARIPFALGPQNPAWVAQSALSESWPAYAEAALQEREAARAKLASLRFTAPWRRASDEPPEEVPGTGRFERPSGEWCIAQFDVNGPFANTIQRVGSGASYDRGAPWMAAFDREKARYVGVPLGRPPYPRTDHVVATALDPRRRRLVLLLDDPGNLYTYALDTNTLECIRSMGTCDGQWSMTWSPHDDCFYALGSAQLEYRKHVMSLTRIDADGTPAWRIPLAEPTADGTSGGDLAEAGAYVVVLTPPLPDPLAPDAPPQQRCVVIDPHAGAVVYSGPIAPH